MTQSTIATPVLARIGAGIELAHRGKHHDARALFARTWDELGPGGDPFHRALAAHHLAAAHDDDPAEALRWNLRALHAAYLATDDRAGAGGFPISIRGLYPLLHLNLAESYRRLGDLPRARDHLRQGRLWTGAMREDAYGHRIRAGLDRLADRLQS